MKSPIRIIKYGNAYYYQVFGTFQESDVFDLNAEFKQLQAELKAENGQLKSIILKKTDKSLLTEDEIRLALQP